ncbi:MULTISPECIES: tryptophan 7-halogenase [unclassified Sphingomonas]|uniref:tryptophan 7-halogenase n=1 Tax=unclassified Sphingomonas TaxID=196159 RepID=UPI0021517565|nr:MULTISPECIES: tryptophan 7-halogenase [unclassified Sphingomonas]MCR5871192.1 tryptophan 7-halogenase [Sphingomonas sp. J344]UUY00497.1 tryptophan 7-halogenase [Sphingomonas sp. J315]
MNPVQTVAVRGGGVAAPMAALAIARAFGRLGVEVTWQDTGALPPPHAALAAPPDLVTFHRLLGLGDAALIDRAAGTLSLGQLYAGWNEGADFLHAWGDAGTPFAGRPFVQHWTRARHAGLAVPLEEFCLAAVAAKHGRIGQPRDPATRQAVKHGWHLDAAGYAALLRDACLAAGVRVAPAQESPPDADLLVDADGSWSEAAASPARCDRMILGSAAKSDPVPLHTRAVAHAAGWTMLTPLGDRVAVACHYDSANMAETNARMVIAEAAGGVVDVGAPIPVAARRVPGWTGKVVTIAEPDGESATFAASGLLELQLAIAQLILLWPVDRDAMPEAALYTTELVGTRARIDDFAAQHFHLAHRAGPYWDAARAAPISAALKAKRDLFAARGMFAHGDHEAHVEDGWALCMAGHGIVPRSPDPQALTVDEQQLMAEFQRQLRAIANEVRAMPTHAQALAQLRSGAA